MQIKGDKQLEDLTQTVKHNEFEKDRQEKK